MNGMANGGGVGAMVGVPAPAAHQTELVYIYTMVEQLSEQLAENKRALEDVVASVGRVRSRARTQSLGNEELLTAARDELNAQEANIDSTISIISELFERAKVSREEYRGLVTQYASVFASMLKQFHDYKIRHVTDVAAWHRSYRSQLADARAENARLREQIWEMQAHAGKANESLRKFRQKYTEDEQRWEQVTQMKAIRQEVRFWKRMAMPDKDDDDPYWSDDDDLIDSAEKSRLQELEKRAALEHLAGGANGRMIESDDDGSDDENASRVYTSNGPPSMGMMGGVPMQREEPAGIGISVMSSRPSSAASSTGTTSQP